MLFPIGKASGRLGAFAVSSAKFREALLTSGSGDFPLTPLAAERKINACDGRARRLDS
jgi:hypothetical protein